MCTLRFLRRPESLNQIGQAIPQQLDSSFRFSEGLATSKRRFDQYATMYIAATTNDQTSPVVALPVLSLTL